MRPSSWIPPVVWMAVIMVLSSGSFSSQGTSPVFFEVVRSLAPWLTPAELSLMHVAVRKMAHFTEYAILGILWFRGLARDRTLTAGWAAAAALAIAVGWAALDETRQSFVATRGPSVADVALDAAGGLAGLVVARAPWRATVKVLTGLLLWIAALGGAIVLAVNQLAGVPSGYLWVTVPAATLLLAARRWWFSRARS